VNSSQYYLQIFIDKSTNQDYSFDENGNVFDKFGNKLTNPPLNQMQTAVSGFNLVLPTESKFISEASKGNVDVKNLETDLKTVGEKIVDGAKEIPVIGQVIIGFQQANQNEPDPIKVIANVSTAVINEVKNLGETTINGIESKLNLKIPELSFPNIPTTPQEFQEALNSVKDLLIPDFVSERYTSIGNSLPPGTIPIIPTDFADVESVFKVSKEVAEKYIEISPMDFVRSVKDNVGEIPTPQEVFKSVKNGVYDATDFIDRQIIQPFSQYAIDEAV
jgi:hypothetical protein